MRRRHRQTVDAQHAAVVRARLATLRISPQRIRDGWVPSGRNADPPGPALRTDDDAAPDTTNLQPALDSSPERERRARLDGRAARLLARTRGASRELSLTRPQLVVIGLVLAIGVVASGVILWMSRPQSVPIAPVTEAQGTPLPEAGASSAPTASPGDEVVVHVAGLVKKPGVITLPKGSRVIDAITAAGGASAKADLGTLNLARVLSDGEQVAVGIDPPPDAKTAPDSPVVNLNSATLEQLETLPGVGPTIAQRIIDWRETHGTFTRVAELREVSGIGERTFAELEPLVTV